MKIWRRFYQWKDIKGLTGTSAAALLLLLAMVTILVDFSNTLMVRLQMQRAAKAGALAGAGALANGMDFSRALDLANAAMREKSVAGMELGADGGPQEVQAGYWDLSWTRDTAPANLNGYADPVHYTPSANEVPAVKVIISRTPSSYGGRAPLFAHFASCLGFGYVDVATFAVAIQPGGSVRGGPKAKETRLVN